MRLAPACKSGMWTFMTISRAPARSTGIWAFIGFSLAGAASAAGQIAPLQAAPGGPVQRGGSFSLQVQQSIAGAVALQWTLSLPPGWLVSLPTTSVPNKVIACAPANLLCLLYGPTDNSLLPAAPVASLTITVPLSTSPGIYNISTTGTLAVSAAGAALPAAGATASITIINDKRDLDGNGTITQSDVQLAVGQIFGSCTSADINGDGKCDLIDLVLILLKAQGLVP